MQQAQIDAAVNTALETLSISTAIDIHRYDNIVALFEDALTRHAARKACSSLGYDLSFAQLDELSANFAAWLEHETL